jgi:threonine/homoserine/homoserine lactone efflux protein
MIFDLSTTQLSAFALASLLLAAAPGPGVTFLIARTLSEGRSAGLAATAGVALGNFGNALGASLGLAALLALNASLFTIVKWLGAAYLIALGIRQITRSPTVKTTERGMAQHTRHFQDGFWVALLNPKTMLFFVAFLPQFLQTATTSLQQILPLGTLFVLIALISDGAYVLLAGRFVRQLRNAIDTRFVRYLTAAVYIGLGLLTGLTGFDQ